jgi:hypothetical protein
MHARADSLSPNISGVWQPATLSTGILVVAELQIVEPGVKFGHAVI